MEQAFPRSTMVEVTIPATVTGNLSKTNFVFEAELFSGKGDTVWIYAIEALSSDFIVASPLTSGQRVASPADIINATVSISAQNDMIYDNLPMANLVRLNSNLGSTAHAKDLFRCRKVSEIDWTKSFITTLTAPVPVGPFSYLFNFYYGYEEMDF
jgi:hypothetical protein